MKGKPRSQKLARTFFARDTHVVAKELLGKVLVHNLNGQKLAGRIVEVEAYVGEDDLACHACRGRTPHTEIMFGQAGYAYIYLIYGMYHCLNIVTDKKNFPAAVLIRALEPLAGIDQATNGPGKLCRAMGISRQLNGEDMTASKNLYVVDDGFEVAPNDIARAPRIGVAYAGACAFYPWRYYVRGNSFVSR